jgi:hypothetical protein
LKPLVLTGPAIVGILRLFAVVGMVAATVGLKE